jgi:hypothetical protein
VRACASVTYALSVAAIDDVLATAAGATSNATLSEVCSTLTRAATLTATLSLSEPPACCSPDAPATSGHLWWRHWCPFSPSTGLEQKLQRLARALHCGGQSLLMAVPIIQQVGSANALLSKSWVASCNDFKLPAHRVVQCPFTQVLVRASAAARKPVERRTLTHSHYLVNCFSMSRRWSVVIQMHGATDIQL